MYLIYGMKVQGSYTSDTALEAHEFKCRFGSGIDSLSACAMRPSSLIESMAVCSMRLIFGSEIDSKAACSVSQVCGPGIDSSAACLVSVS
jgi:hypothetical protein